MGAYRLAILRCPSVCSGTTGFLCRRVVSGSPAENTSFSQVTNLLLPACMSLCLSDRVPRAALEPTRCNLLIGNLSAGSRPRISRLSPGSCFITARHSRRLLSCCPWRAAELKNHWKAIRMAAPLHTLIWAAVTQQLQAPPRPVSRGPLPRGNFMQVGAILASDSLERSPVTALASHLACGRRTRTSPSKEIPVRDLQLA
jgi:hypothetical protein